MRSEIAMEDCPMTEPKHFGGCLCGAVRYQVLSDLQGIACCHCSKCRKFHGHIAAYAMTTVNDLKIVEEGGLKWFRSITDETPDVYRGFCSDCGSSLFWDPRGEDRIAVAAGSLDEPTNMKTLGHSWISQMGDYYEINDNLPKYVEGWGKLEKTK
jgi:hypothetical protein